MNRAILVFVLIIATLGFVVPIFGQEKISVIKYASPRWSPDDTMIAFAADFRKESSKGEEEKRPLVTTGIGKINLDGSGFQIIISNPWSENVPMLGHINQREKTSFEDESYPGGYKPPIPSAKPIVPLLSWIPIPFDWSPDGKRLVFQDSPQSWSDDDEIYIWTVDADGKNLRQLLKTTAKNAPSSLQWLKNGKIVFNRDKQLYWLNPENGRIEKNTTVKTSWYFSHACFSHDSSKMVYEQLDNIFALDITTGREINLTKVEDRDYGKCSLPRWSPDGKRIVFIFEPGFKTREEFPCQEALLWVINANGTGSRPLSVNLKGKDKEKNEEIISISDPSWSSDGRRIAFVIRNDDNNKSAIGVVNIDEPEKAHIIAEE
jgi:Tol biopolymer transport system component